jgi:hypothetical protein
MGTYIGRQVDKRTGKGVMQVADFIRAEIVEYFVML